MSEMKHGGGYVLIVHGIKRIKGKPIE